MKPLIHYVFRHSIPIKSNDNKFNIKFIEREFMNDNPISARKEALEFYENYTAVYQEGLDMQKHQQLENKLLEGIEFAYEGIEVGHEDENSEPAYTKSEVLKFSDELLRKLDALVATIDSDGILWDEKNPELKDKVT